MGMSWSGLNLLDTVFFYIRKGAKHGLGLFHGLQSDEILEFGHLIHGLRYPPLFVARTYFRRERCWS